ncbi:MAG: ABC transporter permease [Candidatus Dormiibacterota bacterium]
MRGIRVAWAIARHQLAVIRAQPFSAVVLIAVPVNFLLLFVLFALSGGHAPIVVYQQGRSPQAAAMRGTLVNSLTFHVVQVGSAAAGQRELTNQDAVALVVIPSGFGVAGGTSVLGLTIDNLNGDFADDIRRGLPLSVLGFYERDNSPALPIRVDEHDSYPSTVSFLGYLAVSIESVALLLGGLTQGGLAMAREWEGGTIKELLLPAVPAWSVVAGKLLGAMTGALASGATVLAILLLLGVRPRAWGELIAVMVALTVVFVGLGLAAGSRLRSTRAVVPLAFALGLPLFFISGAFGPISWGTEVSGAIARVFPVVYANATIQHATYGFLPIDAGWPVVIGVLAAWMVAGLALSVLTYRHATAE